MRPANASSSARATRFLHRPIKISKHVRQLLREYHTHSCPAGPVYTRLLIRLGLLQETASDHQTSRNYTLYAGYLCKSNLRDEGSLRISGLSQLERRDDGGHDDGPTFRSLLPFRCSVQHQPGEERERCKLKHSDIMF